MPSTRSTLRETQDSSSPSQHFPPSNGESSHPEDTDDDVDYETVTEDSNALEYYEPGDGDDDEDETEPEFHDAEDRVEIEVSIDPSEAANSRDGIGNITVTQPGGTQGPLQGKHTELTRAQILHLLGQAGLRQLLAQHDVRGTEAGDAEEEDDTFAGLFGLGRRRGRRPKGPPPKLPPVPNPEGRRLMDSGIFGLNDNYQDVLRKRKKRLARILMNRELGLDAEQVKRGNQEIAQTMIPSSKADTIIHYNSKCYSGQFSDDGNFFFSCAQDFKVRMYDTSNPYEWKYYKTVLYPYGQWTITDATLSPDNKYLAYSSIRSNVCLAVTDPNDNSEPYMLDFADLGDLRRSRHRFHGNTHFGIWSVRFSGDGRELVAGTSDYSVYVYDIDTNRTILRIPGHTEDVNAVCFGDTSSPHILYSGSDDTLIKVWDRRSMGDSREAGVFMGHTEGLTYVDSKGDGRYVLSNGKDQTMKLWDLRKMMSTEQSKSINAGDYTSGFDYRYMSYSEIEYRPHPHDCSVVTFRGHSVLRTLIRCHFSPPGSTNSKYVYSGSESGRIHIYNLDATVAGIIDVADATYETRPRDPHLNSYSWEGSSSRSSWQTCVRDASWHPNAPVLAATSWNGWGLSTGTCTVHSWNDGAKDDESGIEVGRRVNHKLEPDSTYYQTSTRSTSVPRRRGHRTRALARLGDDDDDE